ncbi:unnamed protein product [Closterium sp. NIES-65]|nr:unnamed protein product [Closterium sp. NIES-65]
MGRQGGRAMRRAGAARTGDTTDRGRADVRCDGLGQPARATQWAVGADGRRNAGQGKACAGQRHAGQGRACAGQRNAGQGRAGHARGSATRGRAGRARGSATWGRAGHVRGRAPVADPCGPSAAPSPTPAAPSPSRAAPSPSPAAIPPPPAALSPPPAAPSPPTAATHPPPATSPPPAALSLSPMAPLPSPSGHVAASTGLVTAQPPSDRATAQPSNRAAQQPSHPEAEPPSSRAAQQPSRRAAEPPTSRAAEPPSSRAAQLPSRPTVEPLLFLLLFLQCDRADGLSLFDLTSRASPAPPATADITGCSPSPLLPSVASAAAVDLVGFESVGAASAPSGGRRTGKGKGGKGTKGAGGGGGGGGGGSGGRGGGTGPCTYVFCTGKRAGEQCGGPHSTQRCFGRVTDAWHRHLPDESEIPRWGDLSRAGVAIFDLDYDAILAAMFSVSTSVEGDCYLCVPPDPGIEAKALGASEAATLGASASAAPGASVSAAPGAGESALSYTTSAQSLHTFTLDSGASRSYFRDRTTLTPLSRPVAVSLADPSGGPVLASFSIVLPCPAALSGTLSGLYLPSFSTNLVSGADLQDRGVDQFTPASQRVTHCTCARTGRHLAMFTRLRVSEEK